MLASATTTKNIAVYKAWSQHCTVTTCHGALCLSPSRPPAFFSCWQPAVRPLGLAVRPTHRQCGIHCNVHCMRLLNVGCCVAYMFENIGVSSFYNECRNAVQPFNAVQGGHGGGGAKSPG